MLCCCSCWDFWAKYIILYLLLLLVASCSTIKQVELSHCYKMNVGGNSETSVYLKDLKSFIAVELPCFVGSSSKAFSMLGGEDQVTASLQRGDDAILSLRYSNEHSPFCNGLKGTTTQKRNGLLIKITRKKQSSSKAGSSQSSTVTNVEVLGLVEKMWSFSEPADYQVASNMSIPLIYS